MAIKHHQEILEAFLRETEKTQEHIINHHLDNPGDSPEERIIGRFTRDLQLITTRNVGEMAALSEDGAMRGIVLLALAMLEGVAHMTAPIISGDSGTANHFIQQFKREIIRAHKGMKGMNE